MARILGDALGTVRLAWTTVDGSMMGGKSKIEWTNRARSLRHRIAVALLPWWVLSLIYRIGRPWLCWSNMVVWKIYDPAQDGQPWWIEHCCITDAIHTGRCYCGRQKEDLPEEAIAR